MSNTLGLLAALLWPLPMITALFFVLRDRTLKYRIVFAVMSFVGVGAFWMEASTGKWGFVPMAISLMPNVQPGFYKATIPVGAFAVLTVLYLRARKRAAAAAAKTAPADS
ncbi:hypothetical protein [Caulobacter sp.]|uniref:hypothetical protein n=1 Tax=Caulobacter sp. TaxID=78 RepID=UPI001B09C45F|nr:hypothetical protein [Caulobacter sp.]MBO9546594.1 hypothetical protein [Caulobacter sp.]